MLFIHPVSNSALPWLKKVKSDKEVPVKKHYMSILSLGLLSVLLFSLPSLASELDRFNDLKGNIDIAGGTAHIPVMKDAAKAIMRQHNAINISVAGGGSGIGVQKLVRAG